MKGFYTVPQIANSLQVTTDAVYNWLRTGRLAGYKVGRLWRVTEDQLNDFLKREQEARHKKTQDKSGDNFPRGICTI